MRGELNYTSWWEGYPKMWDIFLKPTHGTEKGLGEKKIAWLNMEMWSGQMSSRDDWGCQATHGARASGECACTSLWWLLPSKWQWLTPFSLCLGENLILCKPICLWIFLSVPSFIWDPGHDNSYSDRGMLIRWKNVHISYLHFNWEIRLRYIICFNVICVRILKGWQYITVWTKGMGQKEKELFMATWLSGY